jgi:hypothetical protein
MWPVKRCGSCNRKKPLDEFYARKASKDGRSASCKVCDVVRRKKRYRANPAAARRATAAWRTTHTEEYRSTNREYKRRIRMDVLLHYSKGNLRCKCCKESEPRFLTLDHVNGGRTKHRKSFSSATGLFEWLRKNGYPPGYAVLCYNCNCAKGCYGRCPHQEKK